MSEPARAQQPGDPLNMKAVLANATQRISRVSALPEVERKVVELRFMHDLTQREIGEQIGYSQMHVSRLLRRALNRLETAAAAARARARCRQRSPPSRC